MIKHKARKNLLKYREEFLNEKSAIYFDKEEDKLKDLNKVLSFLFDTKIQKSGYAHFYEVRNGGIYSYDKYDSRRTVHNISYLLNLMELANVKVIETPKTLAQVKESFRKFELAVFNDIGENNCIDFILKYLLPEDSVKAYGKSKYYYARKLIHGKVPQIWQSSHIKPKRVKTIINASEVFDLIKKDRKRKVSGYPVTSEEAIDPKDYLVNLLSKPIKIESNKTKIDPPKLKIFKIPSIKIDN